MFINTQTFIFRAFHVVTSGLQLYLKLLVFIVVHVLANMYCTV